MIFFTTFFWYNLDVRDQEIHGPVDIFFRIFPPVAGALLASLISLVFFIIYKLVPGLNAGGPLQYSNFLLFGITFLSALFANLIATVFLSFANQNLYRNSFRKAVLHIFFVTVGLFAFSSPFFLTFPLEFGFRLMQLLLPFSAIASALIFEICAQPDDPLRAAYKGIFSGVIVTLATLAIFPRIIPIEMIPFFLMPIAWLLIPLASVIVGAIADQVNKVKTASPVV